MTTAQTTTRVRLEIQKIKYIPPLPIIAQQIIEALNTDQMDIEEIAALIQKDPALTARILGIANSAFFGFSRKIYSLVEAIVTVLGLDLVKGLVQCMIMGGVFEVRKCNSFDISRYWSSALLTADFASSLAERCKTDANMDKNQLFLSGLLHNLGILLLVDRFPTLMSQILSTANSNPETRLIETENIMLDMNHHEAGVWLAHKWQLPNEFTNVIGYHDTPDYRGDHWKYAMLIGYCSRATRNWILDLHTPLPDKPDIQTALSISRDVIEKTASECHARLDDVRKLAQEMAA
jgi:HD-like signal output (HDOD) protein